MRYIHSYLSGPIADALGWTLVHAIWQGFALVLPAALALHFLRDQSSVLRYRVSVLTLLTQLILSAVTFVWTYQPAVSSSTRASQVSSFKFGETTSTTWQSVTHALPWHQQMQQFLEAHLSQFVLMYLIGVALYGIRLAGGWVYLQRLSQTATQPTAAVWANLAAKLQLVLSIQAVVQIRESVQIATPMVIGVFKPIVLVPVGLATHLSIHELEAVLAHELAHIKRHDYLVNLLQSITEVLYFFHPALWWLSARVREEREHCCDDLAVQVCGGNGRVLAQALAHVEELRLTQTSQTPVLAMGFASQRQHLLHRVRRMLGVPTRPFVSNNSLVGLTVATILLMSISVYGVQKQHQPTPKKKQPDKVVYEIGRNNAEFSITDNNTIDYVIWKGRKLPTKHLAGLQQQFDQVIRGQLSLDNVKQPDRDILLAVIETNNSYTDAATKGFPQIDYNNIVASALTNSALSSYSTVDGDVIRDAMESVAQVMPSSLDSLRKLRSYNQLPFDSLTLLITQRVDSLSKLMAQRTLQAQKIQLQMEQFRFPIEKLQRSQEVLNWRKDKLLEQRDALLEKHERLLKNAGKQKLSTAEIEKQVTALEPEIRKLESSMEELNQQFERIKAQQEEAKVPINKLERESEQLEQQVDELSDQIEEQGAALERMVPDLPDLDEDVDIKGSARLNRLPPPARPVRPAKAPIRPAIPPVPASVAHPARPALPARPATAPRPVVPALPSAGTPPVPPAKP